MGRAGGDPLLVTKVEIQADPKPMDAGIAAAKVKVEKATQEIANTTSKNLDANLQQSVSKMLGAAGAATSAVAAVDRLVDSYNRYNNAAQALADQAADIRSAFGDSSDLAGSLTAIEKSARSIQAAAEAGRRAVDEVGNLTGVVDVVNKVAQGAAATEVSTQTLIDLLTSGAALSPLIALVGLYNKGTASLQQQLQVLYEKAELDAKSAAHAAEANRQHQNLIKEQEALAELQMNAASESEKIDLRRRKALDEVAKKQKETSDKYLDTINAEESAVLASTLIVLQAQVDAINARASTELKALDERQRREREANKEMAERIAAAYTQTIRQVQQQALDAFAGERLTGAAESILDRLNAIAQQRRNIRG
jgi:hypothetical protein